MSEEGMRKLRKAFLVGSALLVALALMGVNSNRYLTNRIVPLDLHFEIPNPLASSLNPPAKIPRTVTGRTFCALARGGTALNLLADLRECTGSGAQTCVSVLSAPIELDAINTEVCVTPSDTLWTAGGYLELDIAAPDPTSSPTLVSGYAGAD